MDHVTIVVSFEVKSPRLVTIKDVINSSETVRALRR